MNNKDIVEKKCDEDRCDATGRCSLDKCFYEEEEEESGCKLQISLKEYLHSELIDWHIENAGLGRGCYGDPNGEWNK